MPVVVSSSFFLSSPDLSRRRLDVYHTSAHGVTLVRIWDVVGLKRAARGSLEMQESKNRQKSPSGHHRSTLWGYISSQLRHTPTIGKKLVKQQCLPHVSPQYGELAAEIGSLVWGTPTNFNGSRILAALLRATLVVGVSQTLRR